MAMTPPRRTARSARFRQDVAEAVALEQDAADDAQEVREGKFADVLGPVRHPAEGEHEPREQERRQEKEEGHLHGLELVSRDGREGDAHGQVGGDEDQRGRQQQERMLPMHRHVKRKAQAARIR